MRKQIDPMMIALLLAGFVFAIKKSMNLGLFLLFLSSVAYLVRQQGLNLRNRHLLLPAVLLTLPFLLTLVSLGVQQQLRLDKLDESLRYLLAAPAVFYLAAKMEKKHESLLLHAFGFSWIGILFYGLIFPGNVPGRFDTAWVDVNTLGFGAAIGTFLALYMLATVKAGQHRTFKALFWLASLACSAFILVAAGSRSAWITACACLFIALFFATHSAKNRLAFLGIVALLLGVTVAGSQSTQARVTEVIVEVEKWVEGKQGYDTSTGIRLGLYEGAFALMAEKPFAGYLHAEEQAAVRGEIAPYAKLGPFVQDIWLNSGVHNQYLDRGLNHGVVGLVLWLALYWIPAFLAIRQVCRQLGSSKDQGILILCAVSLLAFGIHGMFHNIGLKYLCSFHGFLIALYFSKRYQEGNHGPA